MRHRSRKQVDIDSYMEIRKIDRRFTNVVQAILRYFPKETAFYEHVNTILNRSHIKFVSVAMPEDTHMELRKLMFAELLPVERANEARHGFMRLIRDCPARSFGAAITNKPKNINKFFDGLISEAWGLGTASLAYIDVPVGFELYNYVNSIEITAYRISSTLAVLRFGVNLSDDFSLTIKQLLKKDYQDEHILRFQISRLTRYRGWGSSTLGSDYQKHMEMRATLAKCQSLVFKFIDKYVPLYFVKKNVLAPSIEIYSATRSTSLMENQDRPNHFNLFWDSIGMTLHGTSDHDIADDGRVEVFSGDFEEFGNLKVLFNNLTDETINKYLEYSFGNLILLLVVYWYLRQVSKKIQYLRSELYRIVSKGWRRFARVLSTNLVIQEEVQLFSRANAEITAKTVQKFVFFGDSTFRQLLPVGMNRISRPNIMTGLENGIKNHISALQDEVNSMRTISTDTTEILATRSTMRGQWVTIVLAVITAILTGITIYVTEHPPK